MKVFLHIFLCCFLFSVSLHISFAQSNQDCRNAIPVCQGVYDQVNSFVGVGEVNDAFPLTTCFLSERNSVWYVFTVLTDGFLGFELTPYKLKNDYDWAVFNLTGISCSELNDPINANRVVSCNYSNTPGVTGATPDGTSNKEFNVGPPINALIPVKAGESYTIIISNFTSESLGQGGYKLDFLKYSTAQIIDNIPPFITDVQKFSDCKIDSLVINFSENIQCSSVDVSDFLLRTPTNSTVIPSSISSNCSPTTTFDKKYTLYFSPPLVNDGTYNLEVVGTMSDICDNSTVGNFSSEFVLNSIGLSAIADKTFLCNGEQTNIQISFLNPQNNLKFSVSPMNGISGDYTNGFITAAPNVSTEYTIVAENQDSCVSSRIVNIEVNPLLTVSTIQDDSVCSGSPFILTTTVSGGKAPYTYFWDPPIEITNTTILEPEVDPTSTRKYFITVTDSSGCTAVDSVEIVVKGVGVINITNFDSVSVCECDSFFLDAGTDFDTFLWKPTNETTQRIYPKVTGSYFVDASSSGGCRVISKPVYVSAQSNNSVVSIVSPTSTSIGDTIDIVATITTATNGDCLKPRTVQGSFEFNPTVLHPLNQQSFGTNMPNGKRAITINDTIRSGQNEYPFKYIVTFGNEEQIRFKTNPTFVSECMVASAIVNEVQIPIEDICFEGGIPRLFFEGSTGVGILSVSPNPSIDASTIRYQLREQGLTSLKVYSILGNEVANVLEKQQQSGTYEIDLLTRQLSVGKYFLQLVTPTKTTVYPFEVIR